MMLAAYCQGASDFTGCGTMLLVCQRRARGSKYRYRMVTRTRLAVSIDLGLKLRTNGDFTYFLMPLKLYIPVSLSGETVTADIASNPAATGMY